MSLRDEECHNEMIKEYYEWVTILSTLMYNSAYKLIESWHTPCNTIRQEDDDMKTTWYKRFLITWMDLHGARHRISRHVSLERLLTIGE